MAPQKLRLARTFIACEQLWHSAFRVKLIQITTIMPLLHYGGCLVADQTANAWLLSAVVKMTEFTQFLVLVG